jgi:hypothetical protein
MNFHRCSDTSLEASYLTAEHLGLYEGTFKKVQLYHECDFNLSADNNVKIESLVFYGSRITKGRRLNIEEVSFNELEFNTIYNEGLIQILNCRIGRRLAVVKSNLGQLQLTNVTIDKECRIDILDSNINDVLFNSFKWNRSYKLSESFDAWTQVRYKTVLNFLFSLRESYRQLKANYLKNGNKIEALEFQKGEMNMHYRILSSSKFSSFRNLGNFLIVATNKWASDFGQNIWKPLLWLLIMHLVVINLLILSFNVGICAATSFEAIDCIATIKGGDLFFHTLLPTHFATVRALDNSEVYIGGFLDFLSRILSGYFIFYFISASRKYHQ